jgi:NADH dehydrogenase
LAVRLGRKHGAAHVTLIDSHPFHIWKPSLHEVAAGTMDIHREGLSYAMLAHYNDFRFVIGKLSGVDRNTRQLNVDAWCDVDGEVILPERQVPYDTLVLALGSFGNFFNTPGAEQYAISLDSTDSAEKFRMELLKAMARAGGKSAAGTTPTVNVVIVGGGATGVELAAELHETGQTLSAYGLPHVDATQMLRITVVEGGPRILGPLPERVADAARNLLTERGVVVEADCRVSEVTPHSVLAHGKEFPSDLCVWAAGIKAPALLGDLGLELNRVSQIVVNDHLCTPDPAVYALGDCAAAPWGDPGKTVPARAQAAHQQASYLFDTMTARIAGSTLPTQPFRFRDFGSLVSLGHTEGVGNLMGGLMGRSLLVEGWVARVMYASSHWTHYATLLGVWGATMRSLSSYLSKRSRPRVKLH